MPEARGASLTAVDLFCGAGGLSEGLRQAGIRVLAGNDHDPDACATYAENFPDAEVFCGDIREPELHERVVTAAASADILVGGPPCQAFSQVRNHTRIIDDPRNSLYREFVRTVAAAKPSAFLMENVPGMAQMGVKEQVVTDLSLDGEYEVRAQLVDAVDFGVPQTRKRLLFFGVRSGMGAQLPEVVGTDVTSCIQLDRIAPGHYEIGVRETPHAEERALELADPHRLGVVSVLQAIGDLAPLEAGRRNEVIDPRELPAPSTAYQMLMRDGLGDELWNVSVPRIRADTVLRLGGIPAGGNHRDLSEGLRARYLTGEKWGPSNGTGVLGRAHFYAYRRLHPDIWAWTLNTKGDSVYHYSESRCLTVREFARLQSFPDRFVFTTDSRRGAIPGRIDGGAAHSRYRQAGNAVPPLLAAEAATVIRRSLEAAEQRKAS
jgi:DNA (cytosine-5)-methyltransferase 1